MFRFAGGISNIKYHAAVHTLPIQLVTNRDILSFIGGGGDSNIEGPVSLISSDLPCIDGKS